MSREQDSIDLTTDAMDQSVAKLVSQVERTQKGAFNRTMTLVKSLDLDDQGAIKQTTENLRLLAQIRIQMRNAIFSPSFQRSVDRYMNVFPEIESLNQKYFSGISEAFNPNRQLYREVLRGSLRTTKESLVGAGIDSNVIQPVVDIVQASVLNGSHWADMVKELELKMLGSPDTMGDLLRYSKQIATDGINQFNADYNHTIGKDLDLEFYYYSGAKRKTSRPFCKKYANQYFHRKEVVQFGKGKDLDGSALCGGPSKTNLCTGRVKGTDGSSIFRYRGGYNCRHIYKPTTDAGVPPSVINRNIEKGNYNISTDDLIERARKAGRGVQSVAVQKAKQFGGTTTKLNLKTKDSIVRKMNADQARQVDLKDTARTTIIVPRNKIEETVKSFEGDPKVFRIKRQKTSMGYTGTIVNMRSNQGIITEIQVNTPKMIYAKNTNAEKILGSKMFTQIRTETGLPHGQGHKLYEEWRVLDALKGKATMNQIRKMEDIEKQARKYHLNFQD